MLKCLLFAGFLILISLPAHAAMKTASQGEPPRIDPGTLPPEMKPAYAVMQNKCVRCHSLDRTMIAVTTGIAPISGRPFDRAAIHAYGEKMLRKQSSQMSREEVKMVEDLLLYLIVTTGTRKPL